nr:hypothetical protein [Tanacetum cinerariifolium]
MRGHKCLDKFDNPGREICAAPAYYLEDNVNFEGEGNVTIEDKGEDEPRVLGCLGSAEEFRDVKVNNFCCVDYFVKDNDKCNDERRTAETCFLHIYDLPFELASRLKGCPIPILSARVVSIGAFIAMDKQSVRLLLKEQFDAVTSQIATLTLELQTAKASGWSWIFAINGYFLLLETAQVQRLHIIVFHLEGDVAEWYRWMTRNKLVTSWEGFLESVRNRFGQSKYEDPQGALSKL